MEIHYLFEHLFLAILSDKSSNVSKILDSFEFDIFKGLVKRLADKSYIKNMKVLDTP